MTRRKSLGLGRPVRKTIYLAEPVAKAAAFDLENNRFNDVVQAYLEAHYVAGGGLAALERRKVDLRQIIDRAQIELASIDQQTQAVVDVATTMNNQAKAEATLREHIQLANTTNWPAWLHPGRQDVKSVGGMKRAKEILREVVGVEF